MKQTTQSRGKEAASPHDRRPGEPPVQAADAPLDPHAFSVRDLLAMQRISQVRVSPDGKHAAFVLRTTDLPANKGRKDIWIVDVDGGEPRRLTDDPESDSDPRWSPDGSTIYFISARTSACSCAIGTRGAMGVTRNSSSSRAREALRYASAPGSKATFRPSRSEVWRRSRSFPTVAASCS